MRARIVFALVTAVLAVAGPRVALAQLEKPNLTLAVGGKTLVAYLPLTIAERLGLFEKEGLKVTINDFAGGSRALQSLVGGSADIVCGSYEHTILMRAKGQNIKAVALHNNSLGTVIGMTKEKAAAYRSPKDLAGLKIGVTSPGSASSLGVALLLAKAEPDARQGRDHRSRHRSECSGSDEIRPDRRHVEFRSRDPDPRA